jgi:Cytochrome c554 and c-prime
MAYSERRVPASRYGLLTVLVAVSTPLSLVSASPEASSPGSCSSSNCHGSVKPRNSSNVLQNEYTTWSTHDLHSKAYLSLLNSDSKKIASNLGIGEPSKEPLCLACHATPKTHEAPSVQAEDGVTCEACHGASSGWLKSHTATGATHEENVKNGMQDLVPLDARAKLCLSCHYGTEDKTVNHNLYGAGHPRLSFELDTFGVLQPKHWVVDEDYKKRKGAYVPIITWLQGQVANSESALNALRSQKRSQNGMFPELSLFDCYSCHHSLTEDQWKHRSYGGRPGRLKLNLASLVLLREVAPALVPNVAEALSRNLASLHEYYQVSGAKPALEELSTLISEHLSKEISSIKAESASQVAHKVLKALAHFAATNPSPTYELAEQIGMGMQAALASSPELTQSYSAMLKEIFKTLAKSEAFNAERFTAAVKKLDAKL